MAEAVRGINIKLGLNNSQLDTGLKDINKELKNTTSNLNAVNRLLKFDPKNVEALTRKQKQLTTAINDTQKKLKIQNEELIEAEKQFGKNSKEYDLAQRKIDRTNAELAKFEKQLKDTNTRLKNLSLEKFDKLGKLGNNLLPVTAAVAGLTAGLTKLVTVTIDVGDEIAKTAKTIGLTAEELQEYRFVADRLGVSNSTLESSFQKLSRNIGDVLLGATNDATKAFEFLDITLTNADGTARTTNDIFLDVREALSLIEDESLRASLATDIFGRSGAELNNLFLEETGTIEDLIKEVNELGILTNEDAALTEEFADQQRNLQQQFDNVTRTLAISLFPLFEEFLDLLSEDILPVIENLINNFAALDDDTKELIATVTLLVGALAPVLIIGSKVGKLLTTLKFALVSTGEAGIFAGTGINFATLGIGALIALVTTAIATNEELREEFTKLFTILGEAFLPLLEVLTQVFEPLNDLFLELAEVIAELLVPIVGILLNILTPVVEVLDELTPLIADLIPFMLGFGTTLEIINPLLESTLGFLVPILQAIEKISDSPIGQALLFGGLNTLNALTSFGSESGTNEISATQAAGFSQGSPQTNNTTLNAPITINNANDPEAVAAAVNRELGNLLPD